ncbi:META domain-containing protein [Colwellia sp. TT2012]|uniref:META domain-containing protein n=1 Tax=Colwellia sp. TT2012 TaxID=1720342 RepID=UPI00070B9044|nr:META domain-containing protein [Colwellia sp. TT2012]
MINIKRLALLVAITITLSACNNSPAVPIQEKLPGSWLVESIQDKAVLIKNIARLNFDQKNRLSGSASCNNISSRYSLQNNSLNIGPIATTRKMCAPGLMAQESRLLQALAKVKRFQLHNGELSMYDQQGSLQIKAKRAKPEPST